MADPEQPLDADGYLQILRNVTPPDYYEPLFETEAHALGAGRIYEAMARTQAKFAAHIYRAIEARFFRTHSTSTASPSATWQYARGQVRLTRTKALHDPRFVDAPSGGTVGAMLLRGPSGRLYTNEESINWPALDPDLEKDVTFRCTVPGVVGNLDFYADEAGLITLEAAAGVNTEPDLSIVNHANLSDQRYGREASILAPLGYNRPSSIQDSGKPDQFSGVHKGLYVEIIDAATPGNVGRFLRIVDVQAPGVENPAGSGLYPHTVLVDDLPLLSPVLAAYQDDGGVFTDYTAAADSNTEDDVVLLPAVPVVNDAFYVGFVEPFLGLAIAITTPATGDVTLVWETYDGAFWNPYPGIVDDTAGFKNAGESRVEAPALAWFFAPTTVNGTNAYWIRARVTAITVVGTQPLAAKIKALKPNRLTVEAGAVSWAVRDWAELGIKITRIEAFAGGQDDDLGALAEERGITIKDGESDDSLRRRVQELADVVTPAAIRRTINRQIGSYGLSARAMDVQNGLTGLFTGQDFADYYGTGDLFPTDKQKLIDTDSICYGWFLVFVPFLVDGEFGAFADEGPVIWLEPAQTFLASAADMCFADGFPVSANGVYQALWEQINAIRAFGVGFSILRDPLQNVPAC
jgi:hypothetical protein